MLCGRSLCKSSHDKLIVRLCCTLLVSKFCVMLFVTGEQYSYCTISYASDEIFSGIT